MLLFVSHYPDEDSVKDGMSQRIVNVDNFFKTDTNLICKLLDTDPSTVSRAKDQLADFGLIEMKGHKIKVNHNKCILSLSKK